MIDKLKRNLLNIPGWTTKRKIVVIESDDWGSIRMPSKETYTSLLKKGYKVDNDPYLKYDSLATTDDLSHLFEVLNSFKDKNGRSPIITANTIVANPDFKKIKQSNFESYYFESFLDTLSRYKGCENAFDLWKEGIDAGLFFPQFHGREHLNVDRWIKSLQEKDKNVVEAFNNEMISISSEPSSMKFSYMEGMDFFDDIGKENRKEILEQGTSAFEKIFKYKSLSYIANCYIWDDYVEEILSKTGVKYIQGVRVQKKPKITDTIHSHEFKSNYLGKKNALGQIYLVRNVHFEPSQFPDISYIDKCLKEISTAFFWRKPAIISSHRLNFIGSINEKNRINNLDYLSSILGLIIKKWPDVEFMSSAELGNLMTEKFEV